METEREEYELMKQSKYRVYMSNVDKALKNFEYSSEWADLISALGKLSKVISSNQQYQIIPRRIKISKRLAQCMHPALPSGVHLKALESYDVIFSNIGSERLAAELFIYSAGLFPLLSYAAMNTRPSLLGIYEKYFVPLGERLRPALSGFLSGILPALECGLDHFERTNALLEKVCMAVNPMFFYTCLWESVVTNSSVRLPAMTYVVSHFNKHLDLQDQSQLLGKNQELLISGLCACLNDNVILVQRNTLEFLLLAMPMHTNVVTKHDLIKLVKTSLNTILRRDMSLNRRLYSWLLGTDISRASLRGSQTLPTKEISYFEQYSKRILISAFTLMLKNSANSNPIDPQTPYRILMSLLDKADIGQKILDDVLCDVIRTIVICNGNNEVHKQANLLFSTFDPSYIWFYMAQLYRKAIKSNVESKDAFPDIGSGIPCLREVCHLSEYLLDILSLEMYSETTRIYLPKFLLALTQMLTVSSEKMDSESVRASLKLCIKIISKVQPVAVSISSPVKIQKSKEEPVSSKENAEPTASSINHGNSLEKSNSDSKLHETLLKPEQIKRSNSNQNMGKKSPKSSKKKKSKSYNKLSDLDIETEKNTILNAISTPNIKDKTPAEPKSLDTSNESESDVEKKVNILDKQGCPILEKCIKQYVIFFETYAYKKLLQRQPKSIINITLERDDKDDISSEEIIYLENSERIYDIDQFFSRLKLKIVTNIKKLKSVLNKTLSNCDKSNNESFQVIHVQEKSDDNHDNDIGKDLLHLKVNESLRETIKLVCSVMVEISSFPNYDHNVHLDEVSNELPNWLKVLSIICTYLKGDHELQLAAIQTLIDMISLLKTNIEIPKDNTNENVTHVLMMPLLKLSHVNYLERKTKVFQIVTSMLWDSLSSNSENLRHISLLLYQINNCLESNFVENVIINKMLHNSEHYLHKSNEQNLQSLWPIIVSSDSAELKIDVDSLQRFQTLWQFGRETPHSREFDMLLFLVLDSLTLENHVSIRIYVIKWLQESLLRGDLGRLLKPLLKVLLDESTKRTLVANINAYRQQEAINNEELPLETINLMEKNCYAISTEDGSVTYLTSSKKRSPIRSIQKKIFGVSLSSGSKQIVNQTANYIANNVVNDVPNDLNNFSKISVIINPLESDIDMSSIDDNGTDGDCDSTKTKHYDDTESDNSLSTTNTIRPGDCDSTNDKCEDNLAKFHGHVTDESLNDRIKNGKSYPISGKSTGEQVSMSRSFDFDSGFETSSTFVNDSVSIQSEEKTNNNDSKKSSIDWEQTKETLAKSKMNLDFLRKNSDIFKMGNQKLHSFHSHLLIYDGIYDTKQILYIFETLKNMLTSDTRFFLCLSVTTSMSSNKLKTLMTKIKKNMSSRKQHDLIDNSEFYGSSMFLEVIITILLYYVRGYFSCDLDENNKATNEDIYGNCKIHLECISILTIIFNEFISIIKDMGRSIGSYIKDVMDRCRVQKIVLNSLASSVYYLTTSHNFAYSEQLISFNDAGERTWYAESLQIEILKLLLSIMKLENELLTQELDEKIVDNNTNGVTQTPTFLSTDTSRPNFPKYIQYTPISQQPLFLTTVLSALQSSKLQPLHKNWLDMITSSLTCYTYASLTNIVISVIYQICANLERICKKPNICNQSTEYIVSQLEAMTVLSHYCLLDSNQQISLANILTPMNNQTAQIANSGQIFNNIVNIFLSSSLLSNANKNSTQTVARNTVLSHMPRVIFTIAQLWETKISEIRNVKQQLLEFLSPVSLHYGVNFLAAISVTWFDRSSKDRNDCTPSDKDIEAMLAIMTRPFPQANENQMMLIKLISGIRIISMDSFIQTITQIIKNPPNIYNLPADMSLEVSTLELLYFYMKSVPDTQFSDCWTSLYTLLKDSLSLQPLAQFVMLTILNEYVQRSPIMPFTDKKDLRDLHDVSFKLIDAVSVVAGACLEQTTWLRRNLAVKEDLDNTYVKEGTHIIAGNQKYSIAAQTILATVLSTLLDCICGQDKDKITTVVVTVMYNIVPYLKTHTTKNIPSFYACSKLLANLAGYQNTRKAWRKDALDLLLDSTFFQMDSSCLPYWKTILDSLMACDNTTFRELMNRLPLAQTGSLNIFTSKEQEYEQRALLLKRLAFVIFCSEIDQYHKYMPEIQEQLANSLRLPQVVPLIQAAVLLCFRVLLLRMSADHITSLWPIIISEMVQVFLSMEQELKTDTEELSPHWRAVQLETAKLLELGCVLPATILPHFQMYRWAFVSSQNESSMTTAIDNYCDDSKGSAFVPHVARIAQLMDLRYTCHSPKTQTTKASHIMLTCQSISTLQDLYSFFSTLSMRWPAQVSYSEADKETKTCLEEIEKVLSLDFLDKMPTK